MPIVEPRAFKPFSRRDIRRLRLALLAGCCLLTGCFALVPVDYDAATPPMRVRAHLTPEAAERLAPALGGERTELNGRLVERTPEGIFLEVRAGEVPEGFGTEVFTQRILLAPGEVEALQRRELDRPKTALLAGAGAVAVGAVIYDMLTGESGGTTSPPGPGGPPEVRIPLLVFPTR